ncbi:glycosyl hydrolase family 8 [Lactobacillus acetotolerans]|uniref:glycosyl hydrolase family 8 n=1 Tax=Lactobacillus acetotolerans TaxID=1600 RepID=UPI0030B9E59C
MIKITPLPRYPMITIVVPAHNEEVVIAQTTRAILDMNYPADRVELLLYADNCADKTADEMRRALADPRYRSRNVKIIERTGSGAKAGVLNDALKIAHGDYIGVYDADAMPETNVLYFLVRKALENPERYVAVFGRNKTRYAQQNFLTKCINQEIVVTQRIQHCGIWHLFRIGRIPGTNFIIQRQYQKNGHWASDINSATDGDLFIAMALHQAARVWPKRAGYYRNLERHLTNDILAYEYNPHTRSLTVGDWATSKSKYYRLMRTSDVAPTFFDTFYQSSHDQRWRIVKDGMLDHLADLSAQHRTGLVPDFAWVTADSAEPVKPWTVASKNDGNYFANACRVPMMLANSKDPRAQKTLTRMMKFFSRRSYVSLRNSRLHTDREEAESSPISQL